MRVLVQMKNKQRNCTFRTPTSPASCLMRSVVSGGSRTAPSPFSRFLMLDATSSATARGARGAAQTSAEGGEEVDCVYRWDDFVKIHSFRFLSFTPWSSRWAWTSQAKWQGMQFNEIMLYGCTLLFAISYAGTSYDNIIHAMLFQTSRGKGE